MRLLELTSPGSHRPGEPAAPLRLHPRLAVVRAGSAQRAQLIEQIASVMAGQASTSRGLVEVHGVLFDFSGETAVLLALDGAVQPVLRSSDLPGMEGSDATRQRRHLERQHDEARRQVAQFREAAAAALAERENLERRLRAVDDELGRRRAVVDDATERLEAVRRDHRTSLDARDAAAHRRRAVQAELAQIDTRRAELELARAELERRLTAAVAARDRSLQLLADADARLAAQQTAPAGDPAVASAAVDAARAALSAAHLDLRAAEARLETVQTQVSLADAGPTDGSRALLRRRDELVAELRSLDLADPREVDAALAAATQAGDAADPTAGQLAARLAEVAERRRQLDQGVRHGGDHSAELRNRLEQARAELASAVAAARGAMLDPGARATVERAHEDVLEAEDKASRRFAGSAAKARLAELRETEAALLAQFGLSSFSDYLLSASTARVDPAAQIRLSAAEREVVEAEADLAAAITAPAPASQDPELRQLATIEAGLRDEAVRFLGHDPGPDLIGALRSFDPGAGAALAGLEGALARVGVAADAGSVVDAAKAWLADRSLSERRAHELQGLISGLDAELANSSDGDDQSLAHELAAAHAEVTRLSAARADASAALVEARRVAEAQDAAHPPITEVHATLAAMLSDREVIQRQVHEHDASAAAVDRELDQCRAAVADQHAAHESLQRQLAALEAESSSSDERCERLSAELDRLERALVRVPASGPSSGFTEPPDAALLAAQEAEATTTARLAQAQQRADELWAFTERARAAEAEQPGSTTVSFDDLEFYVLGRVAAQRAVGLVGSVPLVIDDALAGLPAEDIVRLLDRLDRLTSSVQVVYLTEDPVVLRWAMARPADRVSLVEVPVGVNALR
jgi:hypothetical protein